MLGLRPVTCYLFGYFVLYFNYVSLTCLFNSSCVKISHIVPAMLCCFGVLFGVAVGWFPYFYSQSTVACLFASVLHHFAALFCLFLSFYTSLCVIIFWYWIQLSLCVFHSFSPCTVLCIVVVVVVAPVFVCISTLCPVLLQRPYPYLYVCYGSTKPLESVPFDLCWICAGIIPPANHLFTDHFSIFSTGKMELSHFPLFDCKFPSRPPE